MDLKQLFETISVFKSPIGIGLLAGIFAVGAMMGCTYSAAGLATIAAQQAAGFIACQIQTDFLHKQTV